MKCRVALWRTSSSAWPEWDEDAIEAQTPLEAACLVMRKHHEASVFRAGVHSRGCWELWTHLSLEEPEVSFYQHFCVIAFPVLPPVVEHSARPRFRSCPQYQRKKKRVPQAWRRGTRSTLKRS
jgi:hypothetical protein